MLALFCRVVWCSLPHLSVVDDKDLRAGKTEEVSLEGYTWELTTEPQLTGALLNENCSVPGGACLPGSEAGLIDLSNKQSFRGASPQPSEFVLKMIYRLNTFQEYAFFPRQKRHLVIPSSKGLAPSQEGQYFREGDLVSAIRAEV